jgi:DNA repair protein RecO (recombination protein O)
VIITTPALVLKAIDFQESSRIVTLLTPEHGKIAVMVRGARKPKSKFAGFFEAGNLLDTVIYIKASRTIQNLSEVSYRHRTWGIRRDYGKLAIVMQTMEMLDQLIHDNENSKDFYNLADKIIPWLSETEIQAIYVFPYIMIRLAEISGIGIQWDTQVTSDPQSSLYLNIEDGALAQESGLGLSFKLTPSQSSFLKNAITAKNSSIFRNPPPSNELKLLIHHLDVYFKHHIEGLRDRKSDAIFEQIL